MTKLTKSEAAVIQEFMLCEYNKLKEDPANLNMLYAYIGVLSSTIHTILDRIAEPDADESN